MVTKPKNLMYFYHILHAGFCDHFQWFPHTPMHLGLKRFQNNDLLLAPFSKKIKYLLVSPWQGRQLGTMIRLLSTFAGLRQ